MKTKSITTKSY